MRYEQRHHVQHTRWLIPVQQSLRQRHHITILYMAMETENEAVADK